MAKGITIINSEGNLIDKWNNTNYLSIKMIHIWDFLFYSNLYVKIFVFYKYLNKI